MARRIKLSVVVARRRPVGSRRDHRGLARGRQRLKDARIGVERLVCDQRIGLHRGQQVVGPLQVVRLAAGQEEVDRVAQRVDQGVDFGAQSAARAPDRLVLTSFFGRRRYAGGRAQQCCRSSRIRCRRLRRDVGTSAPRHRFWPNG